MARISAQYTIEKTTIRKVKYVANGDQVIGSLYLDKSLFPNGLAPKSISGTYDLGADSEASESLDGTGSVDSDTVVIDKKAVKEAARAGKATKKA